MSIELEGAFDGWEISSDFLGGLEKTETTWRGRDLVIETETRQEDEIFRENQVQLALVQNRLQKNERVHRLCGCEVDYPLPYEQFIDSAKSQLEVVQLSFKKFWKKHKKAILITAAVVAVVACVAIAAVVLSSSAASTVAGVGGSIVAGTANNNSSPSLPNIPPSSSGDSQTSTPLPPSSSGSFEPPKGAYNSPHVTPAPISPTDPHYLLPSSQLPSPGFQPSPISFPIPDSKTPCPSSSNFSSSPVSLPQDFQNFNPSIQSTISNETNFWETKAPSFSQPPSVIPSYSSTPEIFSSELKPLPQSPFTGSSLIPGSNQTGNLSVNPLQTMREIALQNNFFFTPGTNNYPIDFSHPEQSLNALSYQMRGEAAHSFGCYPQAINDFSMAIGMDPTNPNPYLQRSASYFDSGQYDRAFEDFHEFAAQTETAPENIPFSTKEFTYGFVRGLPKGIYESGAGLCQFLGDLITHPIHTATQMYDALSTLAQLAREDQWGVIGEALSPEIHELITQWDTLSSDKRGELAGYALGKHGGDILVPGAVTKIAGKGLASAQELTAALRSLQRAETTLILETATGMGNPLKVGEIVRASKVAETLTEELGFTRPQIMNLKQAGQLESTLQQEWGHLSLSMQESMTLHKQAQAALEIYVKKPLPEWQVRALIQQTGIQTFARPKGIPENYLVMVSDKGAGMKYVHPNDPGTYVRVMPGKPYSPFPCQRDPYVNQRVHGNSVDKYGNKLEDNKSLEAHIPLGEFNYKD